MFSAWAMLIEQLQVGNPCAGQFLPQFLKSSTGFISLLSVPLFFVKDMLGRDGCLHAKP